MNESQNVIEFSLLNPDENKAFAMLCANLNAAGVPYSLRTEMAILHVEITISTGY